MLHTQPLSDTSKAIIDTLLDEAPYKTIKQTLQCIKRNVPSIDIYTVILEKNLKQFLKDHMQHVPSLLLVQATVCLDEFYAALTTALPTNAFIRPQSPLLTAPDTLLMVQDEQWEVLREYVLFLCAHPEEPNASSDTFIDLMANSKIPADIICSLLEGFTLSDRSIEKLACTNQLKSHIYAHLESLTTHSENLSFLKRCLNKEASIGKFFHEKTNKYNFFVQEPGTLGKIRDLSIKMEAAINAFPQKLTSQDLDALETALSTLLQTQKTAQSIASDHSVEELPSVENATDESVMLPSSPENNPNQAVSGAEPKTRRLAPLYVIPTLLFLYSLYINMQSAQASELPDTPQFLN